MDRYLSDVQALNKKVVIIAGSFLTGNAGAPTKVNGLGYAIARTGSGVITVTLAGIIPEVLSFVATGEVAITSVYATKVLTITLTGGDVAAKQINFIAIVQNSTVPAV